MSTKSLANFILLLGAVAVAILLVYGVVGIARLWAHANSVMLSTTHKVGITVLGMIVALLLIERVSKFIFLRDHFHLTSEQLAAITAPLSIFHPFKELLGVSELHYGIFEERLGFFCKALEQTSSIPEWRRQKVDELLSLVDTSYPQYRDHLMLGLARLSKQYPWLPSPEDTLLRTIARTDDLGKLGQILVHTHQNGIQLYGVAMLRYVQERERSRIANSKASLRHIEQLMERSKKSEKSLVIKKRGQGRKPQDYFKDYEEQQVPA